MKKKEIFYPRALNRFKTFWAHEWMRLSGRGVFGRFFLRLAEWGMPPFYDRKIYSKIKTSGYISSKAHLYGTSITLGNHVFIDDGVFIFECWQGGHVSLADGVTLYRDTIIQYGQNGCLKIGEGTTVQPRCQFSAYKGAIDIGKNVQIAPNCAFYPYNHTFANNNIPISKQPLKSAGGISIGNDVWFGYGVIVLDGVRIGDGAVIGAGSVVTQDIPTGGVAAGVPARVKKNRFETSNGV